MILVIPSQSARGFQPTVPSKDTYPSYKSRLIMSKKKTTEEFITESKIVHPYKYTYHNTVYINAISKICITCKKHGDFWMTPNNHLSKKQGCPECKKNVLSVFKSKDYKFFIQILTKKQPLFIKLYDYTNAVYSSTHTPICVRCKIHGNFYPTPGNHIRGSGCPHCNMSKGELSIRCVLMEMQEPFIPQKKFSDCINIQQLPFDFYCHDINLCIEFNGIQHYKPVKHFGGDTAFKIRKNRDKIKMEYCLRDNTPNLLVIPYWEQHNIPSIISQEILRRRVDAASISAP